MTVAFLGLTGTQGVLPFCYTEWMIARKAAKDDTLAAFFDLFNHRLRIIVLSRLGKAPAAGPL